MVTKKADMRIQQMAFMIIFVFIFFSLVGMFFLRIQLSTLKSTKSSLDMDLTISSIETIMNMPELNCGNTSFLCIDEDKVFALSSMSGAYSGLWPISSLEIRKIYPKSDAEITCPAANCTTYKIYDSMQSSSQKYGTFVSLCKKVKRDGIVQDDCTIAKLEVGVKIKDY